MALMSDNELLTCAQIAVLADRSERTIWRWRKAPDFPAPVPLPCGGRLLFERQKVERFLAQLKERAA